MDYVALTYVVYLGVSLLMTVWVARSLAKNGWPFLADTFGGNEDLASSVNELLVVGFYLVNAGLVLLLLRIGGTPQDYRGLLETASFKIGVVLLVLGLMHFGNLAVLARVRRRGGVEALPVGR